MEKTQEILKHLFDLYSDKENSEEEILKWCEKNMERFAMWRDAFEKYDTIDVINALDEYWRYGSNKTKPTVAKILALLNTNKVIKQKTEEDTKVRYFNIESDLMHRDMELKRNTDCILSDYKRAVDYILIDKLIELIGGFEYRKLDSVSEKYKLAVKNGLFNDFDDVMLRLKRG